MVGGPTGPLGSTNQNWLCAKLLPMAVSIYPVVCVHSCHLLGTQYYCLCSKGRVDCLRLATHPHHPTPPPCNAPTQFYMVGKKPSVKADLAIYSQAVDIRGQCMSESLILGHNLDFSSCDIMVGFRKSSHNYHQLFMAY